MFPFEGGKIGVMDAIVGQTIGGTLFSVLAGQPLVVIMTTAPIALYIKIIVAVAEVGSSYKNKLRISLTNVRNTTWISSLFTRVWVCGTLFT